MERVFNVENIGCINNRQNYEVASIIIKMSFKLKVETIKSQGGSFFQTLFLRRYHLFEIHLRS